MRLVFLCAAALLCASSAHADGDLWRRSTLHRVLKQKTLRVGLEPDYVPFEMKSKSGQPMGFDIDVANAMAEAMGVKLKLVVVDWKGIMPGILTDQYDIIMSGMTITPERNLWINFADPYFTVGQTVLLRRGLRHKIKQHSDLNKKRYTVVTRAGVTAQDAVTKHLPKAKVRLFDTAGAALAEVLEGRADAFVYDLPFNTVQATRHKKKLVHLAKPFTHERLGWGIRKGDPDFLNWLNHFLDQIKGDGTYERIRSKWFDRDDWASKVQ